MAEVPAIPDHGATGGLQILPVHGMPEFRPGDDLAAALASAAPWLADGDVVVVTSKIVSKVEGRLVAAPVDPDERDVLRRELVDAETERVLARRGKTLIVANKLGIVQAAAGVDGSNVRRDELALLPADPDASADRLRSALRDLLGVDVAVVITDTMGRCWRIGQTDAAIGSAGLTVLHRYGGAVDVEGNELHVTEVALADELAAAADLVKGKLGGVPVAVVRGAGPVDDGSTARDLVRPLDDDANWLAGLRDAHLTRLAEATPREFSALARDQIGAIVELQVDHLLARVAERGIEVALTDGAKLLSMETTNGNGDLFVITEKGYGKRTPISEYPEQNRGGQGVYTIQMTVKKGLLAGVKVIGPQHEIMIVSAEGIVIRVRANDISKLGRSTQGVRIMDVADGDRVMAVARMRPNNKSKAAQLSGQGTLDLNAVTDGGLDEVDLGDGEEGSVDEALEAGE